MDSKDSRRKTPSLLTESDPRARPRVDASVAGKDGASKQPRQRRRRPGRLVAAFIAVLVVAALLAYVVGVRGPQHADRVHASVPVASAAPAAQHMQRQTTTRDNRANMAVLLPDSVPGADAAEPGNADLASQFASLAPVDADSDPDSEATDPTSAARPEAASDAAAAAANRTNAHSARTAGGLVTKGVAPPPNAKKAGGQAPTTTDSDVELLAALITHVENGGPDGWHKTQQLAPGVDLLELRLQACPPANTRTGVLCRKRLCEGHEGESPSCPLPVDRK